MNIIEKRVKDLKPYEKNPRLNDDAVKYVAESIKEFGFKVPIVIDKDNNIVCGHTRWKACKKLKIDTVPCVVADDLTEEQIRAYRLADNKVGEKAEWDLALLDTELAEIETIDMTLLGFDDKEEETPREVVEDDFDEEPPAEPKSKYGDLYQLGRHRLMCGDSTKTNDVECLMGGYKADMVFTDPPYGVSYTDKNEFLNRIDASQRLTNPIENDNKTPTEMAAFWEKAFNNLAAVSKEKMAYYITSPQGGDLLLLLLQSIANSPFSLKHMLIWNKNNHVLGRCDYNYKHEPIVYGWKKKGTHTFYGGGNFKTTVWDIPKPLKNDLHPTMKPIALVANCILDVTKEGDVVLDIFGGSGTTLIAAEQLHRKAYLMELDPHYCDVIIARWEKETGRKAVRVAEAAN